MIRAIASKFDALRSASANLALDLANGKEFGENLRLIKESGLFNYDFYLGQLQANEANLSLSGAISHYLNIGAKKKLDPHPLFDTAFYIQTNPEINFANINPLVHFMTKGWSESRNPHPLFDCQYYLSEYEDVRRSNANPLAHYISFGASEKREPSPLFDPTQYKKKVQEADLIAYFSKYLAAGKKISFSRKFKTTRILRTSPLKSYLATYLAAGKSLQFLRRFKTKRSKKVSPILKRGDNPIIHFLYEGAQRGILPFANFELLFKLQPRTEIGFAHGYTANFWRVVPRDLVNDKSIPERFASFARQLAKTNLNKEKYSLLKELVQALTFKKNAQEFMQTDKSIVLLSHQASLTGAPLLLLQAMKELTARGWECLLILERRGELEDEFAEVAHIINLFGLPGRHKKTKQYLSLLFDDLRFKKPKVCLLNSLETGQYAKPIDDNDIKIISLVHEIVDTYSTVFLEDVFERSKTIVFPAKFVRDFAKNKIGSDFKCSREIIIPNALLEEDFGSYSRREGQKQLRQEISAEDNALVVLGCGSPDMRKGIDIFVTAAKIILGRWEENKEKYSRCPVHFVWIGADKMESFTAHYYVNWDLIQGDLKKHIHFLPSRKDLRPAFRGADIFVLPSRKDPFPCVVHNAMAAELPIVTFKDAGGVPEMVEGGGAKIVPYGDILSFVQAVEHYLVNEQERIEDGKLNAKIVAERFRFHEYISKLEDEIKTLVKSK